MPIVFAVWVLGSNAMLMTLGDRLPVVLTNVLSLSWLPFLPFVPFLKTLGLAQGEWFAAPTPWGLVVCTAIYGFLLHFMGKWIEAKQK